MGPRCGIKISLASRRLVSRPQYIDRGSSGNGSLQGTDVPPELMRAASFDILRERDFTG